MLRTIKLSQNQLEYLGSSAESDNYQLLTGQIIERAWVSIASSVK